MTEEIKILDACCGSRMFWFDKNESHTTFMDIRKENFEIHGKKSTYILMLLAISVICHLKIILLIWLFLIHLI